MYFTVTIELIFIIIYSIFMFFYFSYLLALFKKRIKKILFYSKKNYFNVFLRKYISLILLFLRILFYVYWLKNIFDLYFQIYIIELEIINEWGYIYIPGSILRVNFPPVEIHTDPFLITPYG